MDSERIALIERLREDLRRLAKGGYMAQAVERRIAALESGAPAPVQAPAREPEPTPEIAGPAWLKLGVGMPRIVHALGPIDAALYFHERGRRANGAKALLEPCMEDECGDCGARLFTGYYAGFEASCRTLRIAWVRDVDDVPRVCRGVTVHYQMGRDKLARLRIGEPGSGAEVELPDWFSVRAILMRRYNFRHWPGEREPIEGVVKFPGRKQA